MAIFLFAVAVLFVATSADYALRAGNRSNKEGKAAFLAQSKLASLRQWGQQGNNFANYSTYPGLGTWQSDDFGFQTRVELVRHETYSPSSISEVFLPQAERRAMSNSLLRARVQVRWGPSAVENYQLVTQVGDGRKLWRATNPIVVTPVSPPPVPLPQGDSADFQAQGFDASGQPIPDLFFSWQVVPGTSVGILTSQSNDGHNASFTHHIVKLPGPGFDFGPAGEVWVQATARFWGIEQSGRFLLELE